MKNKTLLTILLILLVVVVGIVSYAVYYQKKLEVSKNAQPRLSEQVSNYYEESKTQGTEVKQVKTVKDLDALGTSLDEVNLDQIDSNLSQLDKDFSSF
jgi:Tfp pilus assembly protein PilO